MRATNTPSPPDSPIALCPARHRPDVQSQCSRYLILLCSSTFLLMPCCCLGVIIYGQQKPQQNCNHPSWACLQVYDGTDVGLMFKNFYKITGFEDVPCTLVIDPITGAKQLQLNGYVSAER